MKTGKAMKKVIALFISIIILSQPVFAAQPYESRAEIPEKYKWKLTDIYKTDADWGKDIKLLVDELLPQITSYKGKLNDKDNILACFNAVAEADNILGKIENYASFALSLDGGSPEAQSKSGKAMVVFQKYAEAASYITPELVKTDEKVIRGYMADPDFKDYVRSFEVLLKSKQHILSENESELLAGLIVFSQSPSDIYTNLTNVDISFPSVKDSEGNDVAVTESSASSLLESPDRDFRKAVFESVRKTYKSYNNTLAATLSAEVSKNIFFARAGNYNSALEASLSPDISVSVYDNLISSANKGLAPLHKYISLRKDALGVESVRSYDMIAPIIPGQTKSFSYDEAEKLIKDALKTLGKEYGSALDTAFSQNWIDVYTTQNKRSGAYSADMYGVHPFVLLNYGGTYEDVTTVAHELGHAVHQYYSSNTQPYDNSGVAIFTTEAASTSNEILLCKFMIENAKTNADKLFYVNRLVNLYYGTFYSQTLMAEFEKQIHDTANAGGTLTAEAMNAMWLGLQRKYYGESYEAGELDAVGWSRIPHMYYNFYVYQYATCIAAANQLTSGIIEGKPGALDKYLEFLHSGSQYDPVKTLANAGVDMTSPKVFEEFTKEFDSLVSEMERLMKLEGIIK